MFFKGGNAKIVDTWSVKLEVVPTQLRHWKPVVSGTRGTVHQSASSSASSPSATTSPICPTPTAPTTTLFGTTRLCRWIISYSTPASLAWKLRTTQTRKRKQIVLSGLSAEKMGCFDIQVLGQNVTTMLSVRILALQQSSTVHLIPPLQPPQRPQSLGLHMMSVTAHISRPLALAR